MVFSIFSTSHNWLAINVKLFPSWLKTTKSQLHPKAKEEGSFFLPISFHQDNLSQKSLPRNFPRSVFQGPLIRVGHMAMLKLKEAGRTSTGIFHLYEK